MLPTLRFFVRDDAEVVAALLAGDGYEVAVSIDDHLVLPWAVRATGAPPDWWCLALLVSAHNGALEGDLPLAA